MLALSPDSETCVSNGLIMVDPETELKSRTARTAELVTGNIDSGRSHLRYKRLWLPYPGLEPTTLWLEVKRSNQLNHAPWFRCMFLIPNGWSYLVIFRIPAEEKEGKKEEEEEEISLCAANK